MKKTTNSDVSYNYGYAIEQPCFTETKLIQTDKRLVSRNGKMIVPDVNTIVREAISDLPKLRYLIIPITCTKLDYNSVCDLQNLETVRIENPNILCDSKHTFKNCPNIKTLQIGLRQTFDCVENRGMDSDIIIRSYPEKETLPHNIHRCYFLHEVVPLPVIFEIKTKSGDQNIKDTICKNVHPNYIQYIATRNGPSHKEYWAKGKFGRGNSPQEAFRDLQKQELLHTR